MGGLFLIPSFVTRCRASLENALSLHYLRWLEEVWVSFIFIVRD